jgi:hypothetical protein
MKGLEKKIRHLFWSCENNLQSGCFYIHWFGFHTVEQEHFDIFAQYRLGEVDSNIGSETYGDAFTRGIGRNSITLGMIWMHLL